MALPGRVEERLLALEGDKDQLHMQVVFVFAFLRLSLKGSTSLQLVMAILVMANYRMNTGLDAVGPDPQPDGQDPRPGEDPGQQEGGAQEDRGPPADRDDQQVAREHRHK